MFQSGGNRPCVAQSHSYRPKKFIQGGWTTKILRFNTLRPFGPLSSSECDFDFNSDEDTSPKSLSVLNLSIFVVQPPCINFLVIILTKFL